MLKCCLPSSQNKIGAGRLMGPKGVAVDKNGHIITVDNKACCVFIFQSNGKLVTKFGGRGTADRQFAGETAASLPLSEGARGGTCGNPELEPLEAPTRVRDRAPRAAVAPPDHSLFLIFAYSFLTSCAVFFLFSVCFHPEKLGPNFNKSGSVFSKYCVCPPPSNPTPRLCL